MANKLFITGNSSGLGQGLSELFLEKQWQVYGCSRRGCELDGINDVRCDLTRFDQLPQALETLLQDVEHLDLIVLNAGILGQIKPMSENSVDELRQIMEVNVWSNKVVLDWLLHSGKSVDQIVMISSGAAVLGNKGWGGYALSKSALNMLGKLYAHEFSKTHISAIAPGLIDTPMMDYLCVEPDPEEYPALQRIRDARGTDVMPKPKEAAERIWKVLPHLKEYPSGSFIDIRKILSPDEYERLMDVAKR